MILPDQIAETGITLKDQYFDLRGLSTYSARGIYLEGLYPGGQAAGFQGQRKGPYQKKRVRHMD